MATQETRKNPRVLAYDFPITSSDALVLSYRTVVKVSPLDSIIVTQLSLICHESRGDINIFTSV